MYLVDRQRIEEILQYMEKCLDEAHSVFCEVPSFAEKLAAERLAHGLIESVLDVGHMLIDGFMMRDAGSYADIIQILHEEDVITETEKSALSEFLSLRSLLVRSYDKVDPAAVRNAFEKAKTSLLLFPDSVRAYWRTASNVAHTFKKPD